MLVAVEVALNEGRSTVDSIARVGEGGLEGCEDLLMVIASGLLSAADRVEGLNDDLEREVVLKRDRKEDR